MTFPFDEEILSLPFYEERHRTLAGEIAAWTAAHSGLWTDAEAEDEPEKTELSIIRALGEDGWFAFLNEGLNESPDKSVTPDFRSLCLRREGLAYADDLADYAFSIQALAAMPILRHASAEQRVRYLPGLAGGSQVAAFALSEEQAGSDVAALQLRAERAGDGYVLNGSKAWVANGGIADLYTVIARTGEGPGALGLTAFLVPATTPGLQVHDRIQTIAPRAFAHLTFEECRLPADSVLGRPGHGFVVAVEVLDRFRMTVGAAALGFARRAMDAALGRAAQRPIYDGRLIDLPTVRATLADMEVQLNAAALLVARAAWELDEGRRRFARHSSIAKLYATEAAQDIVDAAVQIHGAAGLVADSPTGRLYRQIRSLRIYEGTSEIQRTVIAQSLDLTRADRRAPSASS
ncbi:acyl-CoA dehydrogenase family protein [Actinomadura rudentiformis]|uniref:Acyl-CoA dehydrogenase family protein n=1 Tax=Actinomadura rudentiformis TaxID=359158 RepID=A0A6H9YKJ2_9ACTN|nr:acyl-CoA dehydrogenase family protein [Actinomadura rudentiformis]KAB2339670.1 acyl-CoA dehydrogenase family protein [Actinomadura rudentiformis]